jgi:hypothetical protein
MGFDMGDYLRTLDEAIDAVADILEMPSQRDRLIQSTVKIMMCMNPEPREFMSDSQALLIEGGLEALAAKRRELLETLEAQTAVVILNPEEDGMYDAVGSSLDALRLSDVAFRVFPQLRSGYEHWRVARALRRNELRFEELLSQGIRRRGGDGYRKAQESLEKLILADEPIWASRKAQIHDACRDFIQRRPESETPVTDTEILFSVVAVDDVRAVEFLALLQKGPEAARELARRTFECVTTLRSIQEKAA